MPFQTSSLPYVHLSVFYRPHHGWCSHQCHPALGFKESRVRLLGMASFMCRASLVALTQCWRSGGKEGTHSVPFLHVPIFLPFSSLLQKAASQHSFPLASCPKYEPSFPQNNPLHYLYYTVNKFFTLLLKTLQGADQ